MRGLICYATTIGLHATLAEEAGTAVLGVIGIEYNSYSCALTIGTIAIAI